MRFICMWIGAKPLCIMFDKVNGDLLDIMMELRISYYLFLKNMMSFLIRLHIL